jgi:indole-3-glycerol phosphate synthase
VILEEILVHKRKELDEMKLRFPLAKLMDGIGRMTEERRPFAKTLSDAHGIHIIAELKRSSPSRGVLREDFNPLQIAELFELAGADAISVLTETLYFGGRTSYLRTVRRVTDLPILRKDFIIDRYQIYETALLAADAILLISSLLTDEELRSFIDEGKKLGMDSLVEVHTEMDLKKAVDAGASLVGINNRNLRTLKVKTNAAERLVRHVPKGLIVVVESGIKEHEEILRYKSLGVNAFLIGTALMQSDDIVKKLRELRGNHA